MFWRLRNSFGQFIYHHFHARYADLSNIGPVVSFTFDDFPQTALLNGGELLKKHGAIGTYYLAPGMYGQNTGVGKIISETDVGKCLDKGHEVAHHTFSHLDCSKATRKEIIEDITKANKRLENIGSRNFAFPFGYISRQSKKILKRYFDSCRGTQSGINRNKCDLLDLKATAVYSGRDNIDLLEEMILDVKNNGGWLIFYTHDVCSSPSEFGCREEELERLIKTAVKHDVTVASVQDVVRKL